MNISNRTALGLACLVVGIGLCIASLMVRHDVTGWFSRSGLLLVIVGGVLLRRGIRRDDISEGTEITDAQTRFVLVLLRRSPARLNSVKLEGAVRAAWESRFGPNQDGSVFVKSGEEGIGFIIQAYGSAFMVMDTQKGVTERLQRHPELTYRVAGRTVTVDPPTAGGFAVSLTEDMDGWIVGSATVAGVGSCPM
jgi:hypothetical protein